MATFKQGGRKYRQIFTLSSSLGCWILEWSGAALRRQAFEHRNGKQTDLWESRENAADGEAVTVKRGCSANWACGKRRDEPSFHSTLLTSPLTADHVGEWHRCRVLPGGCGASKTPRCGGGGQMWLRSSDDSIRERHFCPAEASASESCCLYKIDM